MNRSSSPYPLWPAGGAIPMSNMMRALVKAKPEPGLWMEEVPVPGIGPNDVLIKVRKSAICGTDVHIWNWDEWAQKTVPVPMVTGHGLLAWSPTSVRRSLNTRSASASPARGISSADTAALPGRPWPPLPQHARRGRQSAGRFLRVSGNPSAQCRTDPRRCAGRDRGDLRSRWATPSTRRCRSILSARTCW